MDFQLASALTTWTGQNLIVRADYHGRYWEYGPYCEKKRVLSKGEVANHFQGLHTIGLYPLSMNSVGRWVVIDIDAKDEALRKNSDLPRINHENATELYLRCQELGLTCIWEDSNGQGELPLVDSFQRVGIWTAPSQFRELVGAWDCSESRSVPKTRID